MSPEGGRKHLKGKEMMGNYSSTKSHVNRGLKWAEHVSERMRGEHTSKQKPGTKMGMGYVR